VPAARHRCPESSRYEGRIEEGIERRENGIGNEEDDARVEQGIHLDAWKEVVDGEMGSVERVKRLVVEIDVLDRREGVIGIADGVA
jgi:hypothetical protein